VVPVQPDLNEGSRLDLGTAPDGSAPWSLEALHTPGHAPGHLVFFDSRYRLLIAGDMVSMLSSVVIAPPDGDLAVYLRSLQRLRSLDLRVLMPGHGSPTIQPRQVLDEALAHRAKREGQLVAALREDPGRTTEELAGVIYRGLPEELFRLARLQVQAGLIKLEREGRAAADGPRWRATS
jgi:glyoxylase-like metal-dependent hydrolase (beta-lactamase superfamily II)